MSRRPIKLADLQAAWADGHEAPIATALLGRRVRPSDVVKVYRNVTAEAMEAPTHGLNEPADAHLRIRPEDVDDLVYDAARRLLPESDEPLIRVCLGRSSRDVSGTGRFALVASVVGRLQREELARVGHANNDRVDVPRAPKMYHAPRMDAPAGEVVTKSMWTGLYANGDGEEISEDEARAIMARPVGRA